VERFLVEDRPRAVGAARPEQMALVGQVVPEPHLVFRMQGPGAVAVMAAAVMADQVV